MDCRDSIQNAQKVVAVMVWISAIHSMRMNLDCDQFFLVREEGRNKQIIIIYRE